MSAFVDALYKLHEKKDTESKDKLFEEEATESINLVVGSIKLPSDKRRQTIKMYVSPFNYDLCIGGPAGVA